MSEITNTIKRIYLVRHGETEANRLEYVPSKFEPLNDTGLFQAQSLAGRLANISFEKIVVSDFLRSQQTAEPIAKLKKLTPEIVPHFGEMLEPTTLHGVLDTDERVQVYRKNRNDNVDEPSWRFEDGETFTDVLTRVHLSKDYLEKQESESVLVVAHGFFLQMFGATILLDADEATKLWFHALTTLRMSNTGISLLTYDAENKRWRVVLWNDYAHFAE